MGVIGNPWKKCLRMMVSLAFDIILCPAILTVSITVRIIQGHLCTEASVKQCVVFFVCLIIFTEFVFKIYSSADIIVFINRMNIIKLTSIEVK